MGLVTDVRATFKNPRAAHRGILASGAGEERALIYVMLACVMILVSQVPMHLRASIFAPEIPLSARIAGAAMWVIFMMPLALYAVAAAARLIARLFGGRGTFLRARLALFWSLLAAFPLWLMSGLATGYMGGSGIDTVFGIAALVVFLIFWVAGIFEAEFGATAVV